MVICAGLGAADMDIGDKWNRQPLHWAVFSLFFFMNFEPKVE
jgi:hypothetical protein